MELLFGIILISIIVASIAVLAGLGGGILLIPIITILFDYPLQVIVSSVLVSLIVSAGIGAFGAYKRKEIDYKLAFLFEIPTSIGVILGAKSSASIPETTIKYVFATVAVLLGIRMIFQARADEDAKPSNFWLTLGKIKPVLHMKRKDNEYHISVPILIVAGLVIGFLSGMLGVGGGWIKVPLLILAFGVAPEIATGTSLFMIIFTASIGGFTHFLEGNINVDLLLSLTIGLGIGAVMGNYLKPRFKSKQISMIIAITLIIVSIVMLINPSD